MGLQILHASQHWLAAQMRFLQQPSAGSPCCLGRQGACLQLATCMAARLAWSCLALQKDLPVLLCETSMMQHGCSPGLILLHQGNLQQSDPLVQHLQ